MTGRTGAPRWVRARGANGPIRWSPCVESRPLEARPTVRALRSVCAPVRPSRPLHQSRRVRMKSGQSHDSGGLTGPKSEGHVSSSPGAHTHAKRGRTPTAPSILHDAIPREEDRWVRRDGGGRHVDGVLQGLLPVRRRQPRGAQARVRRKPSADSRRTRERGVSRKVRRQGDRGEEAKATD